MNLLEQIALTYEELEATKAHMASNGFKIDPNVEADRYRYLAKLVFDKVQKVHEAADALRYIASKRELTPKEIETTIDILAEE